MKADRRPPHSPDSFPNPPRAIIIVLIVMMLFMLGIREVEQILGTRTNNMRLAVVGVYAVSIIALKTVMHASVIQMFFIKRATRAYSEQSQLYLALCSLSIIWVRIASSISEQTFLLSVVRSYAVPLIATLFGALIMQALSTGAGFVRLRGFFLLIVCLSLSLGILGDVLSSFDMSRRGPAIIVSNNRLYGLADHPNELALIAFMLVGLAVWFPGARSIFALSVGMHALYWTDSRVLLGASAILCLQLVADSTESAWKRLLAVGWAGFALLPIASLSLDEFVSLNGRTRLWAIAVASGQTASLQRPGTAFGDELLQVLPYAGHAHNQAMQGFAEFGLIGLLIWTTPFWLFIILFYQQSLANCKGGGLTFSTVGVAIGVLARLMTEVPLPPNGYGLTPFSYLAFCSAYALMSKRPCCDPGCFDAKKWSQCENSPGRTRMS